MNDTFMKEKPILPLILSMSLPMVLSMLVNLPLQHCGQLFCRADQRGSDDGVITGLPGSKFYQCGWNWVWCWDQRSDCLLSGRGKSRKSRSGCHTGTCACRDSWRCYDSLLYRNMPVFLRMSLHPKRSLNLASAILPLRSALHSLLPSA